MATEKRLIDAGDLWSDIMMLPHNGDMISSEEVEQTIIEAPTVDVVKYGHWIIHSSGSGSNATNWAECSECHVCGSPQWKRCPVCEAKMDGDVNG